MSVVKKHQTGGSMNYSDEYEQFIADKLNENNFTAKSLPIARKVANRWVTAHKGDWDNIYQSNPVTGTYGINKAGLPPELQNEIWEGSGDEIKRNILGQFNARPDGSNRGEGDEGVIKKYNTLMANWTDEFHRSRQTAAGTPSATTQTSTKRKASIKSLGDYILNDVFKGSEGAFDEETNSIPDNVAMKQKIMEWAVGNLDLYSKSKANYTGNEFDYQDIDPAIEANIRKAQQTGDWETFRHNAHLLGWETDKLLKGAAEQNTAKTQEDRTELYKKYNISNPELTNFLTSGEYELDLSNTFEGAPDWLSSWMTKNNALLFKNKYNHRAIVQNNKLLDKVFNDPDDITYGTYFTHNNGVLDFQTYGMETWDKARFLDTLGTVYGKKDIKGSVQGYEGWSIEGLPMKDASGNLIKDSINNTDFTGHLILRNPSDGSMIELFRQSDGTYKNIKGQVVTGIDIQEYGDSEAIDMSKFIGKHDIYNRLGEQKYFSSVEEIENIVDSLEKTGVGTKDVHTLWRIIKDLRYRIKNAANETEREKALALYDYFLDKNNLPEDVTKRLMNLKASKVLRDGGKIFKAVRGMSATDFLAKHKEAEAEATTGVPIRTALKSNIGSLKDWKNQTGAEKTLDVIAGAGTITSFVPVVGAAGAGVMTGAEFIKDLIDGDDEIHWGQHALNLGFTGLSLVGLGGLKGIQSAAKLGKGAMAFEDILKGASKVAQTSGKGTPLVKSVKNLEVLESKLGKEGFEAIMSKLSSADDLTKIKLTNLEKSALKEAGIFDTIKTSVISKAADTGKVVSKNKTLPNFEKIKGTLTGDMEAVTAAAKSTIKTPFSLTALVDKTGKVGKYAKTSLGAMTIASTVPKAGAVYSDIKEGGIGSVKTDDVKDILMSAAIAKQWMRSARATNLYNKYTRPVSKTEGSITLKGGEKPIKLSKEIKLPKELKGPLKGVRDKKAISDFKKALKKEGVDDQTVEDLIKNRAKLSLDIVKPTASATREMNPESLTAPGASLKKFEQAKQVLMGKVKYEEGGKIPKFQVPWGQGIVRRFAMSAASPQKPVSEQTWKDLLFPKVSIAKGFQKDPYAPVNPVNIPQSTFIPGQEVITKTHEKPKGFVPTNEWLESIGWNDKLPKAPVASAPKQVTVDPNIINNITNEKMPELTLSDKELGINPQAPISIVKPTPIFGIKGATEVKEQKGLGKLGINPENISNLVMYLSTLRANEKIAKNQRQALVEGMVNTPTIGRQYLRITSPYSPFYDMQARKMASVGKNMQESVADVDKGMAARLSANNQAIGLTEKGMQADTEAIQQGIDKQINVDRQTDLVNNEIVSKNLLRNADIRSKMPLVNANKLIANNTALNNFLLALQQTRDVQEHKNRNKQLYNIMTDPKVREIQQNYTSHLEQMKAAKSAWDSAKPVGATAEELRWEDSSDYKTLEEQRKHIQLLLDDFRYKTYNAQLAMQMQVPMRKRGGTLDEQEYLLKLRRQHSKEDQKEKDLYKSILANNELLRKSLLKIFK